MRLFNPAVFGPPFNTDEPADEPTTVTVSGRVERVDVTQDADGTTVTVRLREV